MNTAQSNAAGDRRERRFTLKLLTQIGIIFGICWISTCIERVLPFTLPASIIGMLLLLALLLARVIKTEHIREKSDYLLGNLPFFFIPASVSIINYADVLRENLLALVVVCAVSLIATFAATVGAVRLTCRLLEMSALWESPFFGVTLTILAYWAGCKIQKRTGLVICNGLVLAVMMIIAVLAVFDIPYAAYNAGGSLINLFLGPATVCLAVTIYAQIDLLKKNLLPILAGCAAGAVTSVLSIWGLCRLFGLDRTLTVSLLPKSVTTPIATAIAEGQGGIVSITVAAVIFTGILGNLCAPALARLFRVKDPVAAGLAIGACSHAMGTARALELGETEGAMSGLAIGLCGLATTILALFFDVLV